MSNNRRKPSKRIAGEIGMKSLFLVSFTVGAMIYIYAFLVGSFVNVTMQHLVFFYTCLTLLIAEAMWILGRELWVSAAESLAQIVKSVKSHGTNGDA